MQDLQVDRHARDVYQLHDLKAPKLSGFLLKWFTTILEKPILGYPIRKSVMHSSGFQAFRHRAAHDHSTAPPVNLPLHFPQPPSPSTIPHLSDIDALYNALYPEQTTQSVRRPSIHDYHQAYRANRVTPAKVAQVILEHVVLFNQSPHNLNAVIRINETQVRRDAEASTTRWQNNTPLSVLDGVPFSVKDMLDVVGYSTRSASSFSEDDIKEDADVVKALRNAGMLMIGKCNQDEIGIGVRGFSSYTGQVRNPYNTDYVSGGSSGGCAVSVATGLCPISIGTDAGGSIRIPSACNGVFGLKPTFARISTHGRVLTERSENDETSPSLHVGPIASSAEDLALAYHVMAAFSPHRRIRDYPAFNQVPQIPPHNLDANISGLRIGICRPWFESGAACGREAAEEVLLRMKNAGAVTVQVAVPDLEDIRVSLPIVLMKAALRALDHAGVYGNGKHGDIGFEPRSKLAMGCEFSDDDEARAFTVRSKAISHAVEMFKSIDILLLPALGCDVPHVPRNLETGLVDVGTDSRLMRFMLYGNVTGLPACVFPVTQEDSGVPCGVQVIAGPWEEQTLLNVCLWAQNELGNCFLPPLLCNPMSDGTSETMRT